MKLKNVNGNTKIKITASKNEHTKSERNSIILLMEIQKYPRKHENINYSTEEIKKELEKARKQFAVYFKKATLAHESH